MLSLVLGLLASIGCETVPGRDVRFEPTPMPVVRALLELAATSKVMKSPARCNRL